MHDQRDQAISPSSESVCRHGQLLCPICQLELIYATECFTHSSQQLHFPSQEVLHCFFRSSRYSAGELYEGLLFFLYLSFGLVTTAYVRLALHCQSGIHGKLECKGNMGSHVLQETLNGSIDVASGCLQASKCIEFLRLKCTLRKKSDLATDITYFQRSDIFFI